MTITALTIVAAVLAALVIALAVAVVLLWREVRASRIQAGTARAVADALRDGRDEEAVRELFGYLEAAHQRMETLSEHARAQDQALEALRERSRSHLQRTGVVRFDANDRLSGHLSCALCVLDAFGHGFLITTLYDLERARTFVRAVKAGKTNRELLDPEREALEMALAGGLAKRPPSAEGSGEVRRVSRAAEETPVAPPRAASEDGARDA